MLMILDEMKVYNLMNLDDYDVLLGLDWLGSARVNIDYAEESMIVGSKLIKLRRFESANENVYDVCVAEVANPDSVDVKEWDYNFHDKVKPAGELSNVELEFSRFQKGIF
jgi:hypothetical protein